MKIYILTTVTVVVVLCDVTQPGVGIGIETVK